MITAVIVDDEEHNRNVLRTLLQTHCPEIVVRSVASGADEAFLQIRSNRPQLVFLDIRMPGKNGFDLLKMFPDISFEVIFVSAFDEYAVHAFDFNALDYILKPIDYTKLKKAVQKARGRIEERKGNGNILHFIKTLDEKNELFSRFTVHHNGKVIFINVCDVAFIEAKTDYCVITLCDGVHYMSSKDLKLFENILRQAGNFLRVSKSVIVNADLIRSYTKGELCVIELKTGQSFEVSRRKKTEILGRLRSLSD